MARSRRRSRRHKSGSRKRASRASRTSRGSRKSRTSRGSRKSRKSRKSRSGGKVAEVPAAAPDDWTMSIGEGGVVRTNTRLSAASARSREKLAGELKDMTTKSLREIAASRGIEFGGRSRTALISAILNYQDHAGDT